MELRKFWREISAARVEIVKGPYDARVKAGHQDRSRD
jgi:hypothetical protein